ncbi:tannase and feruloyl esterase [Lyophyllum atratum]|nr:tannase and feruloyl esterase [Lyophyllum atratum]
MVHWRHHTLHLLFFLLGHASAQDDHASACAALKNHLRLDNTTILSSTHISGPANISTPGSCQSQALLSSAICRVQFVVNTTSTSAVHAEAWLPDTWFGRFLGLGNGGLGGCIDYSNLDYGTSLHFAAVASDNGHYGNNGIVFLNHPEVINDFAFRAIHVEAVIGKQIVQAYYGRPHHKSYYLGCSTGGRQGTQAALKFPGDFDGIVAGAPATDWNHLQGWSVIMERFVGVPNPSGSRSFIPPALWDVVAAEVLRQCDEVDGVKDGIITEPDACQFRPEAIQCTAGQTTGCATIEQVDALKKIYQPLFGQAGQLLYPRYDPGTEADGNAQAIFGGSVLSFPNGWFKFAVFNDSNYDFSTFNLSSIALADSINAGGISTFDGDFSAFEKRGGKFLTYHGRRDQLIASGNSKRVYNLISETLSMPSLDSFYRLFLVPGMNHCSGGPGATAFGQGGMASNAVNASANNVLLAMVDWVEKGVAPETIVGTASVDGKQRVHCRYPQRSVWNGTVFGCVV